MATVRVSESVHTRINRVADEEGVTAKEIAARLVDEYVDDVGTVIGDCPECGETFRESDVHSSVLRQDYVVCPNRYETPRGEEPRHSEGGGRLRNHFTVDELERDMVDESDSDSVEELEEEGGVDGAE